MGESGALFAPIPSEFFKLNVALYESQHNNRFCIGLRRTRVNQLLITIFMITRIHKTIRIIACIFKICLRKRLLWNHNTRSKIERIQKFCGLTIKTTVQSSKQK
ncbi:hypothetical protein A1343_17650 [Leptospira interrogans serovar Bataviae]|nr:hypothetical protein A1343_17650 [Leptospira interrogans serovar Bataviae]